MHGIYCNRVDRSRGMDWTRISHYAATSSFADSGSELPHFSVALKASPDINPITGGGVILSFGGHDKGGEAWGVTETMVMREHMTPSNESKNHTIHKSAGNESWQSGSRSCAVREADQGRGIYNGREKYCIHRQSWEMAWRGTKHVSGIIDCTYFNMVLNSELCQVRLVWQKFYKINNQEIKNERAADDRSGQTQLKTLQSMLLSIHG